MQIKNLALAAAVATLVTLLSVPRDTLAQAGDAEPKWGGYIDLEGKWGTERSLGEADFFIPLVQDGRTLFFGNMRGRFDDHDSSEGNLGIGVRRMYDGGWNFGGYGYLDRRTTEHGNRFHQGTLGLEALGRDWDLRGNLYLPYGDKVRDLGTASTASVSANTVIVSSVTTQERALKGFDAEVGYRVPLFAAEAMSQLRVYAGGYHFEDDVVRLSGPRVRVDFTMAELPWLWQGAQLMLGAEAQDDEVRGSQGFASLRLRIPLGGKEPRRLNAQERRMTAPVVRDVDIVAPVVTRAPVVENATALADGRAFSVISSDTTPGANLAAAVAAAGDNSVVLLSGTFDTGATQTVLAFNQTLIGSTTVRTPSGMTATTPGATIVATNATTNGGAVQVRSGGSLIGLRITNTFNAGGGGAAVIVGSAAGGVTLANNTITVIQTGNNAASAVNFSNGTSGTVTGNTITATGGPAPTISGFVFGGNAVTFTGNTISASGGTTNNVVTLANALGTILSGSTGNVRGSGACVGTVASGSIGFTNGTTCP